MKLPFDSLFSINRKGEAEVKLPIRISGITVFYGTMTGIKVCGIDWNKQIGKELEIDHIDKTGEQDVYVIGGIYG